MSLYRTCNSCRTPDVTVSYRDAHCVVLCAECNADWNESAGFTAEPLSDAPETRVVFPKATGVLTYKPFRTRGGQGGGR